MLLCSACTGTAILSSVASSNKSVVLLLLHGDLDYVVLISYTCTGVLGIDLVLSSGLTCSCAVLVAATAKLESSSLLTYDTISHCSVHPCSCVLSI
jgi:hypothetical protein